MKLLSFPSQTRAGSKVCSFPVALIESKSVLPGAPPSAARSPRSLGAWQVQPSLEVPQALALDPRARPPRGEEVLVYHDGGGLLLDFARIGGLRLPGAS